jgi:hypothetical protein
MNRGSSGMVTTNVGLLRAGRLAHASSQSLIAARKTGEKQHACCLSDKLKSRCSLGTPAQEGAAGFAGRT